MTNLKNHTSSWLRADAAAAFDKAEADHGVLFVNSAGRTEAQQQQLIDRWNKGGTANRPPYLYQPAIPASSSEHVKNGGVAIDVKDWSKFAVYAGDYGFTHPYPGEDPVHFEFTGVNTSGQFDQATQDRQNFLNAERGANLVPDGKEGPLTKAEYEKYQTFLRAYGYTGEIDGIWGDGTQTAHDKYWHELNDPAPAPSVPEPNPTPTPAPIPTPAPQYHTGTVADLATLADSRGLQKVARLYGYKGLNDNVFGEKSQTFFQHFLNTMYEGSLANWLRSRWGYQDADDLWGPNMIAAAVRANAANWAQLR